MSELNSFGHGEFIERIAAYLSGGLEGAERSAFEQHRDACASCAAELERAQEADRMLAGIFADARPGGGFEDRIVKELRTSHRPMSLPHPKVLKVASGVAAAIILGAVGFVGNHLIQTNQLPGAAKVRSSFILPTTQPRSLAYDTDGEQALGEKNEGQTAWYKQTEGKLRGRDKEAEVDDKLGRQDILEKRSGVTEHWGRSGKADGTQPMGNVAAEPVDAAPTKTETAGEGKPQSGSGGGVASNFGGYGGFGFGRPGGGGGGGQSGSSWAAQTAERFDNNSGGRGFENGYAAVTAGDNAGLFSYGVELSGTPHPDQPTNFKLDGAKTSGGVVNNETLAFTTPATPNASGGVLLGAGATAGAVEAGGAADNGRQNAQKQLGADTALAGKPVTNRYYQPMNVSGGVPVRVVGDKEAKEPADPKTDERASFPTKYAGFGTGRAGADFREADAPAKPAEEPSQPKPNRGDALAQTDSTGVADPQQGQPTAQNPQAQPNVQFAPQPAVAQRKIIRNGEMEFEVDSFDTSFLQISKIVGEEQGFVSSTNSEKLPNGKVRGTVVVRVPPEHLDTLVLKLRALGDLKSQKISAQDVTKVYYDLESELKAARAMEERLLNIIKSGKGEIKDLLAAEKELGVYRSKIEKFEGEIRYYNNLVSFSTLSITSVERDIRKAAFASQTEQVNMGIESEDVEKARTDALKAIDDAKGRVIESNLKKFDAGQLAATITCEVAPDASGPLIDRLRQLGRVARLDIERKQTTSDGAPVAAPQGLRVEKKDTRFSISMYNLANIAP
ncbi:MAG TPA: DUF4349 domain-containing protein, partial [Tepidisphaeraceae bacterium]|nr:DUF4349 domain-containing protein [Tepidisphaeraceae bacterium]